MESRKKTLDKFSTFLVLINSESYTTRWQTDLKLKKNMERILLQHEREAEFLARRFLAVIKCNKDAVCSLHLTAYLQEISYKTSLQVFNKFGGLTKGLTWQDYFGLATERIAQPELLLCNYDDNKGAQIITYVRAILQGKIANDAYANLGWKLCSDWGLLRKMTKKARQKALQKISGLANNQLEQYLIVWQCFELIYTPIERKKSRELPAPSPEQFQKMTEQYNLMMAKKINTETFREMLEFCIEAARKYQNPQTVAYPENFDLIDENQNPVINLEKEEKQEELTKIQALLAEAINTLDKEEQIMLAMWKGLKITQKDIATLLTENFAGFTEQQYDISRQIERCRKRILKYLLKKNLNNNSKLTQTKLEKLKAPFEESLTNYFQNLVNIFLEQSYHDFYKLKAVEKLETLNKQDLNSYLSSKFKSFLTTKWNLKSDNYHFLDFAITNLIEIWIEDNNYLNK